MDVRVRQQNKRLQGTVEAAPSKSYTHRALFVAAMCAEPAVIINPSLSADNIATMQFLVDMGVEIIVEGPAAVQLEALGVAKPLDDNGEPTPDNKLTVSGGSLQCTKK